MRARKIALSKGAGTQVIPRGNSSGSDVAQREAYAKQLMQDSLSPRVPEQSWTQGAARMVEGLGAALERHKISDEKNSQSNQHSLDVQALASALSGNSDLKQTLSQVQSPDIQTAIINMMQQQRDHEQQRSEKQSDEKLKVSLDPVNVAQTKLAQIEDARDNLSASYAQEQDPEKKAKLEALLSRANETVNSYKDRIMSAQGKAPNIKQQFENQYLQNLAQNGPPGAAEKAAFKSSTNTPEDALQKTIGEGVGKGINEQISEMQAEAHTSSANRNQAEQVLQILAANPNIQSGMGTEQWTKIKTGLNNIFPGMFDGLSDQQAFQKGVGNLLLQNIGKLRSQGVQRITESEIMNVIPAFTPTMLNSPQGIKQILELQNAIDPAIQKGNAALSGLMQKYQSDPNSIPNIQEAINDVRGATQKEVESSSMGYMNAKMAAEGKKLTINPNYDEVKNPVNKYVTVPVERPTSPDAQGMSQAPRVPQPQAQNEQAQMPPTPQPQPPAQMPPQMASPPVDPRAAQAITQQAQGMAAQPSTNNVPMMQQPDQSMAMQLSNPNIPESGQQIDPRKAALIQALMSAQNGQGGVQ